MIKDLKIQNFQSLKNVSIELGGFNTIIGPTDSGKSALFRVITNLVKPMSGDSYITYGEDFASAIFTFDTGVVVGWKKSKTSNGYVFSVPGQPPQQFQKVGREVPVEISNLIKIEDLKIDLVTIPIQFASQFSKQFLLVESPSTISKVIGSLSNFDKAYKAISNCAKDIKATKIELGRQTKNLVDFKVELKKYAFLEREGKILQELKDIELRNRNNEIKLDLLKNHQHQLEINSNLINSLKGKKFPNTDTENLHNKSKKCVELMKLHDRFWIFKSTLVNLNSIKVPEIDVTQLNKKRDFLLKLTAYRESIKSTSEEINRYGLVVKDSELALEATIDERERALVEAGICPICKRETR
jgi:energy-coupling factor transporter ATP-binding protein EcfA2